jgi:hypothetical protein
MRLHACLPDSYWEFAMHAAVHVYNITPICRLGWMTPHQTFGFEKNDLNHLRVFGCGAYAFIPEEKRLNKLSPHSEYMVFIGYLPGGNYLFLRHKSNRTLFRTPTAIFDEETFPLCPKNAQGRAPVDPSTDESSSKESTSQNNDPRFPSGISPNLDSEPIDNFDHSEYESNLPQTPPRANNPSPPISRDLTPPVDDDHLSYTDEVPSYVDRPEYKPTLPPSIPSDLSDGEVQAPTSGEPSIRLCQKGQMRVPTPEEVRERVNLPTRPPPDLPEGFPLRRSMRWRQAPLRPGNIYGDRSNPVDDERMTFENLPGPNDPEVRRPRPVQPLPRRVRGPRWTRVDDEPESTSNLIGLGNVKPLPNQPETEDQEILRLVSEGGKDFINFLFVKAITPVTYKDIDKIPRKDQKDWIDACLEELRALKKRGVYEIVTLPKGRRAIKNRWVFNTKSDGRKRARLVAKGFSQIEGIDFDELFSPVVRYETARLIFDVAALEDWEIESVDVKAAYLYGKLDEEIYMEEPEGFQTHQNKVWRLHRALYGLKQSGLAWWRELTASMKELGFKRCTSGAGVYYYVDPKTKQLIIALVYVDDVAIIGKRTSIYIDLKKQFMLKWECHDLGESKEFLGMRIQRDRKKRLLFIDQVDYLNKILTKFEIESRPTQTPLKSGFIFVKNTGIATPVFKQKYQQLVGSIMYLMIGSRPDIAYATVKLSQQCANPAQEHYDQGLHVLQYLLATRKYRLNFKGASNEALVAYSDSDWAQDPTNRKSVTGNYVTLAKGCVSWLNRKQKTVAASSTEAEYMALSDCSKQLVWIHQLLTEIGFIIPSPYLNGDNEGSIFWASNPVQERRSKHIDIRYHIIHEYIEDNKVVLLYIPGDKNPADIFTKNLDRIKFEQIRSLLGMEFF